MKKPATIAAIVIGFATLAFAEDPKPADSAAEAPVLNPAETKFKELLSNVTMMGRWAPVKDGQLGETKEDQYTIVSVSKVKEDSWIINTRMKYGDRQMNMPFPVQVKFAGDTPVIIVDKMTIPGGGAYSARVLFFEKTYAGSWTGLRGGGLLSGTITKNTD